MTVVFVLIGIAVLALGAQRLRQEIRHPRRQRPRWLARTRSGAEAVMWGLAGLWLLLLGVEELRRALLVVVGVVVIAFAACWASGRLLRGVDVTASPDLRTFLLRWSRERGARIRAAARHGARIVRPEGPPEIRLGFHALDRLLDPGSVVRLYVLALVCSPVLFALMLTWTMTAQPDTPRTILTAVVGYNALAIVSSLTAALLVCVLLLMALTHCGVLVVTLDLRRPFVTIARWVGAATAVGAVTAALMPLLAMLMPSLSSSGAGITPAVLVDVPAGFAVIGYAGGVLHASVEVCRNARGLLVRRFLAPPVLVGALAALAAAGGGPSGVLAALLAPTRDTAISACDEGAVTAHGDDPAWLMRAVQTCGDGLVTVDDHAFLLWVGGFATAVAGIAFVIDFRRRSRAMAAVSEQFEATGSRPAGT